jgi:hypothetical protein
MARKRKGAQDAFEAAEERIGNWKEHHRPTSYYGDYWKGNTPEDADNWVDVEHQWGSSHWYGGTASDECLAKANYEYIQDNVVKAYPDDVTTDIRNGQFAIRALRMETPDEVPEGEEPALVTTTAWDTWIDIENSLGDYASLDDDAMSECEQEASWEETVDNVQYKVRRMEDFDARDDLPERWVSDVVNYVTENLYNYWDHVDSSADGIDISEEHIIEAMINLGYLKRLRDYIDEDVKD